MPVSDVWLSGKQPKRVLAIDLICYWATSKLGITQVWLSKKFRPFGPIFYAEAPP